MTHGESNSITKNDIKYFRGVAESTNGIVVTHRHFDSTWSSTKVYNPENIDIAFQDVVLLTKSNNPISTVIVISTPSNSFAIFVNPEGLILDYM